MLLSITIDTIDRLRVYSIYAITYLYVYSFLFICDTSLPSWVHCYLCHVPVSEMGVELWKDAQIHLHCTKRLQIWNTSKLLFTLRHLKQH